jgi:hypothetical protein
MERRYVGGHECDRDHDRNDQRECHQIALLAAVRERRIQQSPGADARGETDDQTGQRQAEPLAEYEPQDRAAIASPSPIAPMPPTIVTSTWKMLVARIR